MELPAIEALLNWYKETTALDTDVYEVGHHGSHNGTTTELLRRLLYQLDSVQQVSVLRVTAGNIAFFPLGTSWPLDTKDNF